MLLQFVVRLWNVLLSLCLQSTKVHSIKECKERWICALGVKLSIILEKLNSKYFSVSPVPRTLFISATADSCAIKPVAAGQRALR